jgi:hypothetical protein
MVEDLLQLPREGVEYKLPAKRRKKRKPSMLREVRDLLRRLVH